MQFKSQSKQSNGIRFFPQKPVLQLFIIGFLFIIAFCIRLHNINKPPLDFAPTRQYQSANIARGYYFENLESIPEWRKKIALINIDRIILEPRIMERVASFAYRIIDGEHLWIPRVLSSIFWVIGGVFLYIIAKKITTADTALFSTIFYLFLPFGISASRSFQPDPMMLMMMLFSIYIILSNYEKPSRLNLLIAAAVSGLAILIKPYCLFMIFGAFFSLAIYKRGNRSSLINKDVLIFSVISLFPAVIYYGHGLLINYGTLREHAHGSFLPQLLLHSYFWKEWLNMIGHAVGYIAFIGAIIGYVVFCQGLSWALLSGLWVGYFFFGFSATYHIHTHDYYQIQLIPVVAISLGIIFTLIVNQLNKKQWLFASLSIIVIAVVLGLGLKISHVQLKDLYADHKNQLKILGAFFGVNPQFNEFLYGDFKKEVRIAQEIGEIVDHSARTVFLTSDFGFSLSYHGELAGSYWPKISAIRAERERGLRELTPEERFYTFYIKESPEYFIVTDMGEFKNQVGLRSFLTKNFYVLIENDDYIIFSLKNKSIILNVILNENTKKS